MAPTIEPTSVERRARRAYELARLRAAALGVVPLALVVAAAALVSHRAGAALSFGAVAVIAGGFMLWYGRGPQRAVLPGLAAGILPLALALCANHAHACGSQACASLCLPACAIGGVIAGLMVARTAARRRAGVAFWASASAVAVAIGAMGCACIGSSGVVGLVVGYAAGVVPGALRRLWQLRQPSSLGR